MKIKIYFLSIIAFVCIIFSNNKLNAQCNPENQIQPAQFCSTSSFFAAVCDLNGLCGDLQPGSWGGDASFCGGGFTLQNPNWYSFVAGGGVFDINISISNCTGGNSTIQWALYNSCNNLNAALLCNGGGTPSGGQINILYAQAVAGQLYYLVMDGSSASTCHYEFNNCTGISASPVGNILDAHLNGNPFICSQHTLHYSFGGFENATSYTWSLGTEFQYSTLTPQLTLEIPLLEEGIYPLCVTGTNGCDSIGQQICWDLTLDTARTIDTIVYACAGDSARYQETYYPIGSHYIDYLGYETCIKKVNLNVLQYTLVQDTMINVLVCPGETVFALNGINYTIDSVYEDVPLENYAGCRYSGRLLATQIDTTGYVLHASIDPLPCLNVEPSYLSFDEALLPDDVSVIYAWYNDVDQKVGAQKTYAAKKPGHYYLLLTLQYKNSPELGFSEDQSCIIRMDYTVGNSTPNIITPEVIDITTLPNPVKYVATVQNLGDFPQGMKFEWIVPNGIPYSVLNQGTINIFFEQSGIYPICVFAFDGCSTSDTVCIEIIADVMSGIKEDLSSNVRLNGNPVNSALNFLVEGLNSERLIIDVFSIYGNKVMSQNDFIKNSHANFNVSQLIPGTYLYQIRDEKGKWMSGKFVKI